MELELSREAAKGISILLEAGLVFGDLEAYADALTKVEEISSKRRHNYAPTLDLLHTYTEKCAYPIIIFISQGNENIAYDFPAIPYSFYRMIYLLFCHGFVLST